MPTTADLEMTVLDHGTTRLLTLTGELDIASVEHAKRVLRDALLTGSETVVLDLAGVAFLDLRGVDLVLDATKLAAAEAVRLVIVPGPPQVQRVFELAGVLSALPFARSGAASRARLTSRSRLSFST
jgi:anti-sigma B factor antagonist